MKLHPLTAEIMSQLDYSHIKDYIYVLKDDLEIIVHNKLQRSRKSKKRPDLGQNPAKEVRWMIQKMLYYMPKDPPAECQCGAKFESVSDLIRDTAVHYLKRQYGNQEMRNLRSSDSSS